jgi:hypothetical protein
LQTLFAAIMRIERHSYFGHRRAMAEDGKRNNFMASERPIWEGFALLGLRLTRSVVEIVDVQTKRLEQDVSDRADHFYAERESDEMPMQRAVYMISSVFDEVMDRLRSRDE